jgi:DNA-directed RNA polymerase subunit H (RpoH/RPB5)
MITQEVLDDIDQFVNKMGEAGLLDDLPLEASEVPPVKMDDPVIQKMVNEV